MKEIHERGKGKGTQGTQREPELPSRTKQSEEESNDSETKRSLDWVHVWTLSAKRIKQLSELPTLSRVLVWELREQCPS